MEKIEELLMLLTAIKSGAIEYSSNMYHNAKDLRNSILSNVYKRKYPINLKKHVGVEVEFLSNVSLSELAIDFIKAGLSDKISLGGDSSVEDSSCVMDGLELRILDTEPNILNTVEKSLAILNKHNCKINNTCGTHVHLDVRDRNLDRVFNNFCKAQRLLYRLAKPNRETNQFCEPQSLSSPCVYSEHAYGVEISDFSTVEIRMLEGTLDFNHLKNWLSLLLKIANKKTEYTFTERATHKSVINSTNFNSDTLAYIEYKLCS